MHRFYANTTPFYKRDLSVHELWYWGWGVGWNQVVPWFPHRNQGTTVFCQMVSGMKKNKSRILKSRMVREGLTEKVKLEQRSEGGEGAGHEATQQGVLKQKEYQVGKP